MQNAAPGSIGRDRFHIALIKLVEEEAIVEGRSKQSGRVFNPSSIVERILKSHFDAKPEIKRKAK